ncbi:hypothetical protein [Mesobacillus subterraneus]|nr:hypothetical protein [Mesobacillus subterraneus]
MSENLEDKRLWLIQYVFADSLSCCRDTDLPVLKINHVGRGYL